MDATEEKAKENQKLDKRHENTHFARMRISALCQQITKRLNAPLSQERFDTQSRIVSGDDLIIIG